MFAARTAASEAKSLALEASVANVSPRSIRSATRQTSSRAASVSTAMSADQLLHELVAGDGLAELVAPAGVPDGGVEAALRDADAPGRNRHPSLGEAGQGDREALTLGTQPRGGGHPYGVEGQFGGCLAAQPELAVDLARLEAGGRCNSRVA